MASNEALLAVYTALEKKIAAIDVRQGGPQGPQGPVGPKGDKGAVGDRGPAGKPGKDGKDGARGPQGPQGPVGATGRAGKDGKQGPKGEVGPQGSNGPMGPVGPQGERGVDGVSVTDVQVDLDGVFTVYFSDGTSADAGKIEIDGETIIVSSGGGGGGSGGSFTPTTFEGAGTTGYVPDPGTENNFFLRDDGQWVDVSGGSTPPHNQLTGLQGGTTDERYHLTLVEWTTVVDWVLNGLPVFSGPTTSGIVVGPDTGLGYVLEDSGNWVPRGGQVDSVVGGIAVTVDNTDPVNPIINVNGFSGAGTVGYVPDPGTEQGYVLSDSGAWVTPPVSPVGALFLNMRWDSNTAATAPASGRIKANNTDQTLATFLYASDTTFPGNNADIIYESLNPGEYIGLWSEATNEQAYYIITGALTNNGTWWTIPVSYVSGGGGFANNNAIQEFFIPNQNQKVPPGGTLGQVLTKDSNDDWDTSWQTPSGGGSTDVEIIQPGHGFVPLQCIRWNGTAWVLALANDIDTTALGVVTEVVDVNVFKYSMTGRYAFAHGLQTDEWYYLSDTVPGGLTITAPEIEQPIVYTDDAGNYSVYQYRPSIASDITVVQSVVAGTGIAVDNTDPVNPIVSATGGDSFWEEGTNPDDIQNTNTGNVTVTNTFTANVLGATTDCYVDGQYFVTGGTPLLAGASQFAVVAALPGTPDPNTIYFVTE